MNFKTSVFLLSGILLLVLLLHCLQFVPLSVAFVPLALWLILLVFGASRVQLNFFLNAVNCGSDQQMHIALTFDDGPHPTYTPAVLQLLRQYNIKATFFCIGRQIAKYPGLLQQIAADGHVVGNHSFSHSATIDVGSKRQWIAEIEATDAMIARCLHKKTVFFRPPYGVTTPHLAEAISYTGHIVIGWNVRPYDTQPQSPDKIAKGVLTKTKPGSIILLHDTHERIIPVLEQLLPLLMERNYRFTTVEQCINKK